MNLEGKNVLVTGGSSGIGEATAKKLSELGCNVLITGRDPKKLELVANTLGVHFLVSDASSDEDIVLLRKEVNEKLGQLDILINNAGIGGDWKGSEQVSRDDFRKVYETNVFGAAMVAAAFIPEMKERKRGDIVNVASTAAVNGFAKGSVYASSKFALRGLTDCWQKELRPYNIRVIGVNPSEVPTAFAQDNRISRPDEPNKISSEEIAHTIVTALQMDPRGFIPEVTVYATNPF